MKSQLTRSSRRPSSIRKSLLCGLIFGLSSLLAAADVADDAGLWWMSLNQGTIGGEDSKWRWWLDLHARFSDTAEGFEQSIVRPAIGWQLTEHQTIWQGYGWIATLQGDDSYSQEHRFWQQHIWSDSLDSWDLIVRSRFEQRFLESDWDMGLRYRQFVKVNYWPSRDERFYLTAYNELFLNLNDTSWGANAGFDRNRLFAGLGYQLGAERKAALEVGYLNQLANRQGRNDRMTNILSINLFHRF